MRYLVIGFLLPLLNVSAATVEDLTLRRTDGGEAYEVIDCDTAASGAIAIPSTYNGRPVTRIGVQAFYFCTLLTSIEIPEFVTSIELDAFNICTKLTNIDVASGNLNYSSVNGVLFNKSKTTLLRYPAGKSEPSYTIPESVGRIWYYAFQGCFNLTSLDIPDSVTEIQESAFRSCYSLTSITIPTSVTSIGSWTFHSCSSLTSITIPSSVTSIGDYSFYQCLSLRSITSLATRKPSLGSGAFDGVAATAIAVLENSTGYGSNYGGLGVAYISNDSLDATRTAGQQDVLSEPVSYNLWTQDQLEASFDLGILIGQQNVIDDPASYNLWTQAQLEDSFDLGVSLGRQEVTNNPRNYGLFTSSQVLDARPGATGIAVTEGKARITMTLDETSDLSNWSNSTKSDHTIEVNAPAGVRFYRFKIKE